MTRPAPAIACRHGLHAGGGSVVMRVAESFARPTLVIRDLAGGPARRTRLWEFNANLHCSIVGTCLTTGELRQLLVKLGAAQADATDHELHGVGVSLAARHEMVGKQLHKALDNRHRAAVNRFAKAADEDAVRALWRESAKQGDIPGAYWAALTHPATTAALIRAVFGEVHMLSHLVGAANRADICRLASLEAECADLRARLARQQNQLRDAIVSREAELAQLRHALTDRVVAEAAPAAVGDDTLRSLVADLERRLGGEARRRESAERRLAAAQTEAKAAQAARAAAEREAAQLQTELDTLDAGIVATPEQAPGQTDTRLDGLALLYVGGRPGDVPRLRALGERVGASLLHHDGGVEESGERLAGLASRADVVLFPVDCISHAAMLAVKQACRHAGKRYVPLRSSGATSFLAALRRPELASLARRSA